MTGARHGAWRRSPLDGAATAGSAMGRIVGCSTAANSSASRTALPKAAIANSEDAEERQPDGRQQEAASARTLSSSIQTCELSPIILYICYYLNNYYIVYEFNFHILLDIEIEVSF